MTTQRARHVALDLFVREHIDTIIEALNGRARRMREAADEAHEQFAAGQGDPALKTAQDASLVTNQGYRQLAEVVTEQAVKAERAAAGLARLIDPMDDDDDDDDTYDPGAQRAHQQALGLLADLRSTWK